MLLFLILLLLSLVNKGMTRGPKRAPEFSIEVISIKKTISLILLFFLVLNSLTACSTSKADVIQDMVAPKGSYNIFVFWDGENTDYRELIDEMLNVINSEAILKSMNINNMTFISVNDKTQKYNYKKIFDIQQSPTIILLDNEKIILQTNDSKDIYELSDTL